MTAATQKIVYVGCRANVNRSFVVEQLLKNYIGTSVLPVVVTSGGVQVNERAAKMLAYTGQAPQFIKALEQLGLDFIIPKIESHRAHAFTRPELQKPDLILAMTKRQ